MSTQLLDAISKGIFIPFDTGKQQEFSSSDTQELYHKNLLTQPHDWYYRNNPIEYLANEQGYRCQEFTDIDWANSVVVFGCSNVYGVGLHTQDTVTEQLSRILARPVVNLGRPGASMQFSFDNAVILRSSYPRPWAVVNIWTSYDRTVYYESTTATNLGTWLGPRDQDFDLYMGYNRTDTNSQTRAVLLSKTSRLLWHDTRYYEMSSFDTTAELLNCSSFLSRDFARDLIHSGRYTHRRVARHIAEKLLEI
jgi:hypothetical protein